MCGIYGFVGSDAMRLQRAADALSHRGPDFAGSFIDDRVSLGHRLLAIRDNDITSRQPVISSGSPWVLLFNGQLYNMTAMKRQLSDTYADTTLDTSVLYGLIERYGWEFIQHIQGMFAIALYNTDERVIRLYRDQSGQKPIYYTSSGGFAFASEIGGLTELLPIAHTVDTTALSVAAMLGYVPGSRTLFSSVQKVAPSECITYRVDTGVLERSLYQSRDEGHFSGSFDAVMQELIVEHLASKRQIALNLSGGLDSSLILHEATRAGYAIETYSTAFDKADPGFNKDAEIAQRLAGDYGTSHTEIRIDAAAYKEIFYKSYELIEEPNFNISLPLYFCTAQREGVRGDALRVILSGDGGDEVFGGYPYYLRNLRDDRLTHLATPLIFDTVRNLRNGINGFHFSDPADRWLYYKYFRTSYLTESNPLNTTLDYIRNESSAYLDTYQMKDGSFYGSMMMDRVMWLAGENFIRSDKLFMSQSAEMRSPLAYQPFRTYVDTLLRDTDYSQHGANKRYLREQYQGKLPSYITDRVDKTGWRAPVIDWYDASFKELFLTPVAEARSRSQGLVDWTAVEQGIRATDAWPGKYLHFYVTLAIVSNAQNLQL